MPLYYSIHRNATICYKTMSLLYCALFTVIARQGSLRCTTVVKAGTDVISRSDLWWARMLYTRYWHIVCFAKRWAFWGTLPLMTMRRDMPQGSGIREPDKWELLAWCYHKPQWHHPSPWLSATRDLGSQTDMEWQLNPHTAVARFT